MSNLILGLFFIQIQLEYLNNAFFLNTMAFERCELLQNKFHLPQFMKKFGVWKHRHFDKLE